MNTEKVPIQDSPFATNFGVALAVENLDNETLANVTAMITRDPKDPEQICSSIRFSSAEPEMLVLLIQAILDEIEKPEFAQLWEDNEIEYCEEEDE
jgi:hypothetical protein